SPCTAPLRRQRRRHRVDARFDQNQVRGSRHVSILDTAESSFLRMPPLTFDMARARMNPSLAQTLGIELLELGPDRVIATMPVDARTRQPFGILHGGASVALAETVASLAGAANVDLDEAHVVGIEINAN